MKRILFDRSIFHGGKFLKMQSSGLLQAVQSGELHVYYTTDFLEETLRNIWHDITTFTHHWKFLLDLNHQFWFKTPFDIIRTECANGASGDYYLKTEQDISALVSGVNKLIKDQFPSTILEPAVIETWAEQQRKVVLRGKILDLRPTNRFAPDEFDKFVEANAEAHFRDGLIPAVGVDRDVILRWKTDPEKFPFTNYFIRCILSTLFVPMADHQLAVDANDKSDAQQLTFLLWTDVLVSDDQRFMTKAFDILNRGGKKELWSHSELLIKVSSRRTN